MSLDLNRKNAKTQTAYSSRYCKHCEHIKVMMAQAHIFIHFCAVVLLFFVKTVILHASDCKEGWGDSQKNGNFTSFLLVLLIFFLMCGRVLAVALHAQCSVVEFRCSSSLFHQYSGTKC